MAALFTFDRATPQNFAHLAYYIKSIKLTQQLHERALDLSVCAGALTEPPATNSINLVHENDAWLMLLCIAKHLPDQSGALSNVLVHYGAGYNLCKAGQLTKYQENSVITCLQDAMSVAASYNKSITAGGDIIVRL